MPAAAPSPAAKPPALGRALLLAWIAAFAALALLALLDAAAIALRAPGIGAADAAAVLAGSIGQALYVAALLAGGATLLAALARAFAAIGRPAPRRAAIGAAFGALGGLGAAVVLKPWESSIHPLPWIGGLAAAGIAAGIAVALIGGRLPPAGRAAAGTAIAIALFAVDALAFPGLYPRFHDLAALLAAVAAALGARALLDRLPARTVRIAAAALVVVGIGAQAAAAARGPTARALAAAHGVVSPLSTRAVWACFDLDRDGFSALFGGGDCDDLDGDVNPGAREIPGNGRDDNCNGVVDPQAPSRPPAAARRLREPPPDVYFVLVDGLRAAPGGAADAALARALARVGAEGLAFAAAYTPYPSTRRALVSVLASRPWRCRHRRCGGFLEAMARRGYDVQLWMDARRLPVAGGGRPLVEEKGGRDDLFHLPVAGKRGWSAAIVDAAIAELARADAPPRLRWLHLLDTHYPWHCRAGGCRSDLDAYRTEAVHALGDVERLLDALLADPRGRRAAVALLADHGEEFGEHGGAFHGGHLYDETVRVPLAMRLPGEPGRAVAEPASTLDAVPTLAHYLGLPADRCWLGVDRLAPGGGAPAVVHSVSAESFGGQGLPERFALVRGRLKLLRGIDENTLALYDLAADPGETRDLAAARPAEAERLLGELAGWLDRPDCADPGAP